MNNQSAELRLSQTGEVMQRTKENGTKIEQGLRIEVTRIMLHHLRSSMHRIEDKDFDQENKTRRQVESI